MEIIRKLSHSLSPHKFSVPNVRQKEGWKLFNGFAKQI